MKTKLLSALLLFFIFCHLSSQTPQGFNYQAIARDGAATPIVNSTIKIKLSIMSGDTTGFYSTGLIPGTYIWEEEHLNVKTNAFGLFTVIFGDPLALKVQGTANSFSEIDWARGPLYIGTKIANPTTYKILGSAKLWAVPYSMVSDSSKALLKGSKLSVISNDDGTSDALFEVKRKDGQTVFAVYPNAVNVYVPRTAKGTKGGFAIGGFEEAKGRLPQDYFRVTPDSVRIYIDRTPVVPLKGVTKGGFAIGGFDQAKGWVGYQELLTVSNDSIRMYIDRNPAAGKGTPKGGFAIGGFDVAKGTPLSNYMNMTPLNYFIGENSGLSNKTGRYNSFMGYEAGKNNTAGTRNVFLGFKSGYTNDTASFNVFLGNESGYSNINGRFNTFLGYQSGYKNLNGGSNIFFGFLAGYTSQDGWNNIFIGNKSGYQNSSGNFNLFIGNESGYSSDIATRNVFLGDRAGYSTIGGPFGWEGSYNVFIGPDAGFNNTKGASNVFIGETAGLNNGEGNLNLFIGKASGMGVAGETVAVYRNVFLGTSTGEKNISGNDDVMIGNQTGQFFKNGDNNTFIGSMAGWKNEEGNNNTFIGYNSGNAMASGNNNVFLGGNTGGTSGSQNLFLGYGTGYGVTSNNNVFIGAYAGHDDPGGNRLYIDVGGKDKNGALIYGEFDYGILTFNAQVGIGTTTPTASLDINGSVKVGATGSIIKRIIKVTITKDLPEIGNAASSLQTFAIANTTVGSSVMVSPSADLPDGIEIAYARVSAPGTVTVKFKNSTAASIDPPEMDFYITVIE
jgi:hypothetical protein